MSVSWPVWASQTFSVLSRLPLTIRFPSGLKLTLMTASECPLSVSVSGFGRTFTPSDPDSRSTASRTRINHSTATPGSETEPQSPHPSPGVQLRGGNRQIRTTVPPLARGVTPVIAWADAF